MPIELITKKQNIELVVPAGKGVTEAYEKGYADGAASVIDFSRYAEQIKLANLNEFGREIVEINLDYATTLQDFYYLTGSKAQYLNTTVKHFIINCPNKITNMSSLFYSNSAADKTLEHITLNVDTSKALAMTGAFRNMQGLKVIDGTPIDCSSLTSAINTMFLSCSALEEVRFVPNTISQNISFTYSANLSNETVESAIAGLKDLTGATALTIVFHKTVGNKLTDEQKQAIAAKNWTLTY